MHQLVSCCLYQVIYLIHYIIILYCVKKRNLCHINLQVLFCLWPFSSDMLLSYCAISFAYARCSASLKSLASSYALAIQAARQALQPVCRNSYQLRPLLFFVRTLYHRPFPLQRCSNYLHRQAFLQAR